MSRPIYESASSFSYANSSPSLAQKPGMSSLDQHPVPDYEQTRPGYLQDQHPSDATMVKAPRKLYQTALKTTTGGLQMVGRKMPRKRLLYSAVCFLLLIVWFIVMGVFAQVERDNQRRNDVVVGQNRYDPFPGQGQLALEGTLRGFDSTKHTLSVSWAAKLIDEKEPIGTENNRYEIGIYRDLSAVQSGQNFTVRDPTTNTNVTYPVTSVDNNTAPAIAVVGLHEWDSFTTDIDFDRADPDDLYHQLSGYPFENWKGEIVFVANDRVAARETVNITGTALIELYGASLKGSILNWRIDFAANDTCQAPDAVECELHVSITARRPSLVKFAVIVALIVNWSSTIFILVMSCELTIMKRESVIEPSDLLAVCFTALFALPTVRSILPGVGEFGAMNLIGIIPNVIIIAMCTSMVSIVTLGKKDKQEGGAMPPEKLA